MLTTRCLTLGIAIGLYAFAAAGAARSATQEAKDVTVCIEPDKVAIGNRFLLWEMKLENGRMCTTAVTNRRTGRVTIFQGEDFVLEFAGGRSIAGSEFHVESVGEQPLEGGGKQVELRFKHSARRGVPDHRNESRPVVGATLALASRRLRPAGRRDVCALGL